MRLAAHVVWLFPTARVLGCLFFLHCFFLPTGYIAPLIRHFVHAFCRRLLVPVRFDSVDGSGRSGIEPIASLVPSDHALLALSIPELASGHPMNQ
jgi:hypothetical protein